MVDYEIRMGYRMSPKLYVLLAIWCASGLCLYDVNRIHRDLILLGIAIGVIGFLATTR